MTEKLDLVGERENFLKKALRLLRKKKVVSKIIKLDENKIKDIEPHLIKERAQLMGTAIAQSKQIKELQEELKKLKNELNQGEKEKDLIARKLQEQYIKASIEPFKEALSLTKLFSDKLRNNDFEVLSYNMSKNLGKFNDLIILTDGRIGLEVMNKKKEKKIILTADNIKHLFRNFGGIAKTAERGYLIVNLDEKGNYITNIEEEEVPKIIVDAKGNLVHSKMLKARLSEVLRDFEIEKQELYGLLADYEETLNKVISETRMKDLTIKLNNGRAESAETIVGDLFTRTSNIHDRYHQLIKSFETRALALDIEEGKVEALEKATKEVLEKIETEEGKSERERAEGQFKKVIEFAKRNVMTPQIIIPQEEEKAPLEKKFEGISKGMEIKKSV